MRRIAIVLTLVVAALGLHACAADAPTTPRPGPGGGGPGGGGNALQIQLVTTDANPKAGNCTLIEAIVTLNGNPVPDGTSVAFSTDFGVFSQSGLPLVSVVTSGGGAITSLCCPSAGTAHVRAQVTAGGFSVFATLSIVFQPDGGTLAFISSCNPSFGPKEGGTVLTLSGGRLSGTPTTTRVSFTVNGVTKDGQVQSISGNQIVVITPGFPELAAPQLQTQLTVFLGSSVPPVVLSVPSCFTFGTADANTPTITSLLPSSGTNEGNTRVTVVGSGFANTGVQVFFGVVEATVVSVSFNQVVALSPPAFGAGAPNLNQTVPVTVRNIVSGVVSNGVDFRYTPEIQLTAFTGANIQRTDLPFTPLTLHGQGFQAPVQVGLAGVVASVMSVSATEIVVMPGFPFVEGCGNVTGTITVTNIDTGDSAEGLSFTYVVPTPVITSVLPAVGGTGTPVTITGTGFPIVGSDAEVKFGTRIAFLTNIGPDTLFVTAPPGSVTAPPSCTGTNPPNTPQTVETVDVTVTDRRTTCSVTATQAFSYQLPCVAPTAGP